MRTERKTSPTFELVFVNTGATFTARPPSLSRARCMAMTSSTSRNENKLRVDVSAGIDDDVSRGSLRAAGACVTSSFEMSASFA